MPDESARHAHHLFGLHLRVDRPVDGLPIHPSDGASDVELRTVSAEAFVAAPGAEPFYRSPFLTATGQPMLTAWMHDADGSVRLESPDGASFLIDRLGTRVAIWQGGLPWSHVSEYLIGPVAGLVLRRRGVVCLHASAVRVGDHAVAFAGPQGAGKSTLAAACALSGCPAISDDLSAIVDAEPPRVQWGAPYLRMRPGAIETMATALGQAESLTPAPDGHCLDLTQPTARREPPLPLAAIYCLSRTAEPARADVQIDPMRARLAVMTLLGDTWAARLQTPAERAHELDVLLRLVARVPVRRLTLGSGVDRSVVDAVVADVSRGLYV